MAATARWFRLCLKQASLSCGLVLRNGTKDIFWSDPRLIQEVILVVHEPVERERVPSPEPIQQSGPDQLIRCEKIVQPVGESIIEPAHLRRGSLIFCNGQLRNSQRMIGEVGGQGLFPIDFRRTADRPNVVGLDLPKVVLGLAISQSKNHRSICWAEDMRHSVGIPIDSNSPGNLFLPGRPLLCRGRERKTREQECYQDPGRQFALRALPYSVCHFPKLPKFRVSPTSAELSTA